MIYYSLWALREGLDDSGGAARAGLRPAARPPAMTAGPPCRHPPPMWLLFRALPVRAQSGVLRCLGLKVSKGVAGTVDYLMEGEGRRYRMGRNSLRL